MQRFWLARSANAKTRWRLSSEVLCRVAAVVWLVLVAVGLGLLMSYANAPGDQGAALESWPFDSGVPLSSSKPTLLVFAHPKCPCTRATMDELSWLMSRCRGQVECYVLFFHAVGEGPEWVKTDCWDAATSIEGVHVVSDPQSRSATRFGVKTSGHAILYDQNGHRLFEGGITPSRGHRGESIGRAALLASIRHDPVETRQSANPLASVGSSCVFGCPLHAPEVAARRWPARSEE